MDESVGAFIDANKIYLAFGAAAAFFWPQIKAYLTTLIPALPAIPATPSTVVSKTVGSGRADWIADLIALQNVLDSNGQGEAAALVAQAAVKVIGTPTAAKK